MEKRGLSVADKKIHNISARFFGEDEVNEDYIQEYISKVKKVYSLELSKIQTKLNRLESVVYKRGKHFDKDGFEVSRNWRHKCTSKCILDKPLTH